ncbi:MAG: hypothetical protein R3E91_01075 [Chlamydiales bacterium]
MPVQSLELDKNSLKKPQGPKPYTLIGGKPLVVPRLILQEVPEKTCIEFLKLDEESVVWIGTEKKEIIIGECVGCGGSKRAMKISEDEVLMLPNKKVTFPTWRSMVDEEVQISNRLTELGILTVGSKWVDIFLSKDSNYPLPAYSCPSFKSLTKTGRYVIDRKNSKSSCWKNRSYFQDNKDRFAIESWLPIIKPLLQDMRVLAKNNCLFYQDALNLVIIKSEQGYIARYFGFDFSSNYKACERVYGLREDDTTDEMVTWLGGALEYIFWEQYDFDTKKENGTLSEEYSNLIKKFKNECPRILQEMQK